LCFEGVGENTFEVEEIDLGDVFFQDFERQGLIVNGYTG
jgi:hypothetical protein